MNLYNLHSNPKELHGFDVAPYKIPELAYELAKSNPELRPKLEPAIMKDPRWAYWYTRHVLNRPWPEAESVIMKNSTWALNYAVHVLRRPWPEAEPYIMKDPYWWKEYKRAFEL